MRRIKGAKLYKYSVVFLTTRLRNGSRAVSKQQDERSQNSL